VPPKTPQETSDAIVLDQLQTGPALIDQVHDQLVSAIATGRLEPGQRLTQESVASLLGVSRQPVSHALQILKRRGLLIEHGRRGLAVAPLEASRIEALYQIRAVLDGLAARLAAEQSGRGEADPGARGALADALENGEALIAGADTARLVDADVAFHDAIHTLSGNLEIARTVAEQWPQFMRSMGFVLTGTERAPGIWQQHRAIAEAILDGDGDTAERLSREHAEAAARQAVDELTRHQAAIEAEA
jgi:DNA-binding GntR family transcriptional regulator